MFLDKVSALWAFLDEAKNWYRSRHYRKWLSSRPYSWGYDNAGYRRMRAWQRSNGMLPPPRPEEDTEYDIYLRLSA